MKEAKIKDKLNIYSIFDSIDGEVNGFYGAGELTTFVRLKGCNCRCFYCDTEYALDSKPENWMDFDEILAKINQNKVTVTGGEPLIQKPIYQLINKILEKNIRITVETNGTIPIDFSKINGSLEFIRIVMDWKLDSANAHIAQDKIVKAISSLRAEDVVKFVIGTEKDYKDAKIYIDYLQEEKKDSCPRFVFSPLWGGIALKDLVKWMIRDRLNAQFSLQLHKIIWPEVIGTSIER